MKIYDISQEVFSCQVYPGDPAPDKKMLSIMENGDLYNLTAFSMCAHNGTHIDAPFHFLKDGKTVDAIGLEAFVGMAYVAEHQGSVSGTDAAEIIKKAEKQNPEAAKRILIKGDAEVSLEAAQIFASAEILLLGNESVGVLQVNVVFRQHIQNSEQASRLVHNLNRQHRRDGCHISGVLEHTRCLQRIVYDHTQDTEIRSFCNGKSSHINIVLT